VTGLLLGKWRKLALLIVFPLLACLIAVLLYNSSITSPSDAAKTFVRALRSNNVNKAKSLTIPDTWERIDVWMSKRDGFRCPFHIDLELDTMSTVSRFDESTSTWRGSSMTQCAVPGSHHCLDVDEIHVSKIDGRWKVTNWEEPVEVVGDFCP
jgi:hypothetical protein